MKEFDIHKKSDGIISRKKETVDLKTEKLNAKDAAKIRDALKEHGAQNAETGGKKKLLSYYGSESSRLERMLNTQKEKIRSLKNERSQMEKRAASELKKIDGKIEEAEKLAKKTNAMLMNARRIEKKLQSDRLNQQRKALRNLDREALPETAEVETKAVGPDETPSRGKTYSVSFAGSGKNALVQLKTGYEKRITELERKKKQSGADVNKIEKDIKNLRNAITDVNEKIKETDKLERSLKTNAIRNQKKAIRMLDRAAPEAVLPEKSLSEGTEIRQEALKKAGEIRTRISGAEHETLQVILPEFYEEAFSRAKEIYAMLSVAEAAGRPMPTEPLCLYQRHRTRLHGIRTVLRADMENDEFCFSDREKCRALDGWIEEIFNEVDERSCALRVADTEKKLNGFMMGPSAFRDIKTGGFTTMNEIKGKPLGEIGKPGPEKRREGILTDEKDVEKIKSAIKQEAQAKKSVDEKLNPAMKDVSFGRTTGCARFCADHKPTGHANGTY